MGTREESVVQHVVTIAPPRGSKGSVVRVLGILSLGILVGAGAGTGAMFLSPPGHAVAASQVTHRAPIAPPPATPPVAAPAAPAPAVAPLAAVSPIAAHLSKVVTPAAAMATLKKRSRAKASAAPAPAADLPTKTAAAEAQDLEKAQLDALMR